jgi:hypothetical protein
LKLINALADSLEVSLHIQSALGCNFFASFGNQSHLIRHQIQGNRCDLVGDRHFQIQADSTDFLQQANVAILNMAPVFSQMYRDRVCSTQFCQDSRMNRVRFIGTSRLTDGCDVVDVHTQQWHWNDAPLKSLN